MRIIVIIYIFLIIGLLSGFFLGLDEGKNSCRENEKQLLIPHPTQQMVEQQKIQQEYINNLK